MFSESKLLLCYKLNRNEVKKPTFCIIIFLTHTLRRLQEWEIEHIAECKTQFEIKVSIIVLNYRLSISVILIFTGYGSKRSKASCDR